MHDLDASYFEPMDKKNLVLLVNNYLWNNIQYHETSSTQALGKS
jgi:hypothetical protein